MNFVIYYYPLLSINYLLTYYKAADYFFETSKKGVFVFWKACFQKD